MNWLRSKIKVAVHDGHFHPDDVFAVAILSLYLNRPLKIFRTRDEAVYKKMDYLLDVGFQYDPAKNKFDHHQAGLEKRGDGVPYAATGLVWKEFGEKICGSREVADMIDRLIIQDIDAIDNGINISTVIADGARSYLFQDYIFALNPTWREPEEKGVKNFELAVRLAKETLKREIKRANDFLIGKSLIQKIYEKTEDKRIVVLDDNYPWVAVFDDFPEPLFVVRPVKGGEVWYTSCVKIKGDKFKNRLDLPAEWGAKSAAELAEITGVSDAVFCHRALFMCSAKSRAGALKLAELALQTAGKNK